MNINRRKFLAQTSIGLAAAPALASRAAEPGSATVQGERPLVVSTWPFGKVSNDAAMKILLAGGSILDAVEKGIWVTESDRGNSSVGLGGMPNAAGVVQLDACIMSGPGHRAGSVAAIEGIAHPISAARRVMEKTPHVMLVGEGARMFALEEGLESIENNTAERYKAWREKRAAEKASPKDSKKKNPGNHDTIALLVLGADGNIAGGCSTSGWGGKLPGRVGDSPIIGGGLYVDNEVGAAGATGLGENVMRYCGSFLVVELMRQGLTPEEACLEALRRIARQDPKGTGISVSFVALDKKGRYGAAGSAKGFTYSVTTPTSSRVLTGPGVGALDIGPIGGNRK
ncbi:MAG: N(4)-(beta-N-acetylglucosaminyl)-L-asparaginase [Verrucomicrobia bacterium]|nr:MAG: N(4)-(beta-N-acetylglucosaminyl)-L-asparaginase [Verrucomicrobiota bacterium]